MAYQVINIKLESASTLEAMLNELEDKGWVPVLPIWNGNAIVFQKLNWAPFPFTHGSSEAEAEALAAYEQALMSSEEIERLREP